MDNANIQLEGYDHAIKCEGNGQLKGVIRRVQLEDKGLTKIKGSFELIT
jgi:hypothetical protein